MAKTGNVSLANYGISGRLIETLVQVEERKEVDVYSGEQM